MTNYRAVVLVAFGLISCFRGWAACAPESPKQPGGSKLFVCEQKQAPVWSGPGSESSGWYYIETQSVPKGYRLWILEFVLVGPHPCHAKFDYDGSNNPHPSKPEWPANQGFGDWSECWEDARTAKMAKWKYKFQGWYRHQKTYYSNPFGYQPSDQPVKIKQWAVLYTTWVETSNPDAQ
jgi:hypothetical protein